MKIPALILKQLYTFGSLENVRGGADFAIKNRLSDATVVAVGHVKIDGEAIPLDKLTLRLGEGKTVKGDEVSGENPVEFPLRKSVRLHAVLPQKPGAKYQLARFGCPRAAIWGVRNSSLFSRRVGPLRTAQTP